MKKKDFEKWAIETQQDFTIWNGELRWFGFKFWDLELECIKGIITEFKEENTCLL